MFKWFKNDRPDENDSETDRYVFQIVQKMRDLEILLKTYDKSERAESFKDLSKKLDTLTKNDKTQAYTIPLKLMNELFHDQKILLGYQRDAHNTISKFLKNDNDNYGTEEDILNREFRSLQDKVLFLSEEKDYLERSYLIPPGDMKYKSDMTCYIPKKHYHTYSGHDKGVVVAKFFPLYGHYILSGSLIPFN